MLREVIEELVDAWQRYDAHRASAFFAPTGIYCEAGREPIVGREAIFEHFKRFFRDGPAWRFTVDDVIVEEARAALLYRFEIKRNDDRWDERPGCAFVKTEGGLVTEWREFSG